MAEKYPLGQQEQHKSNELESVAVEQSKKNIERIKALAEQESNANEKSIESLREKIETSAEKTENLKVESQETKAPQSYDQGSLKRASYKKTMQQVQSQLPPAERAFSKLIHQRSIETISNFGGKTIARPSGILGGGILACIGSFVVLYYAKHYGFEYNFALFILLYALGFGLGLLVEVLIRIRNKNA